MKSAFVIVLLVLALTLSPLCVLGQNCQNVCQERGGAVCGSLRLRNGRDMYCTFTNFCRLLKRRCATREEWGALDGRCGRDSPNCPRGR